MDSATRNQVAQVSPQVVGDLEAGRALPGDVAEEPTAPLGRGLNNVDPQVQPVVVGHLDRDWLAESSRSKHDMA